METKPLGRRLRNGVGKKILSGLRHPGSNYGPAKSEIVKQICNANLLQECLYVVSYLQMSAYRMYHVYTLRNKRRKTSNKE